MYEALRKGAGVGDLYTLTHIKPWFIEQMQELVTIRRRDPEAPRRHPSGCAAETGQARTGLPTGTLQAFSVCLKRRIRDPAQNAALGVVEAWEPVPVSGVDRCSLLFLHLQRRRPGHGG